MLSRKITYIHFLSFFILLSGCMVQVSAEQISGKFRQAVNDKNKTILLNTLAVPVLFIEQEWESAEDGKGFILGKQKVQKIKNNDKLKEFTSFFVSRMVIEGKEAIYIPPDEFSNFDSELANTKQTWLQLSVYLFKRGEGDVEHIVLIGIDPNDKKVHAIYTN